MQPARRLAARIDAFVGHTETLWQAYQRLGPGKLERSSFDAVESAASEIELAINEPAQWLEQADGGTELGDELQTELEQLTRLARACACTPQGLNFITGEAGLIPRKDQHEALEAGLVKLRELAEKLR